MQERPPVTGAASAHSDRSLIVQGFLALNPKTALFFLAFLPQFITPYAEPANIQILTFGVAFVMLGFLTNSLFGCLGGRLGKVAESNTTFQTITRFVGGCILIVLGVFAVCLHQEAFREPIRRKAHRGDIPSTVLIARVRSRSPLVPEAVNRAWFFTKWSDGSQAQCPVFFQ